MKQRATGIERERAAKTSAGSGNSRCKSPGAGVCLVSLRSSEEVSGVKEGRAVGEAAEEKTELKLCVCVCVCARTHVCSRAQSCPALCSPMDGRPPGSSVHEIFQARTLEWVAITSSRGSSQARDRTLVSVSSTLAGRFFTSCALQPIRVSSVAPRKHDALTGFSQWNSPAPGGSLVAISWRELNFLVPLPVQDLETSKCEAPCLANHSLFLVYGMSGFLIIILKMQIHFAKVEGRI